MTQALYTSSRRAPILSNFTAPNMQLPNVKSVYKFFNHVYNLYIINKFTASPPVNEACLRARQLCGVVGDLMFF